MSRRAYGHTVARIMALLSEVGPMTRAEMSQQLGLDRLYLASIVSRMAKPSKRMPKRLHIVRYVYDMEGQRTYPRAVYGIGDKEDARKPKPDPLGAKRRYNAKIKALHTTNFVFNLALPRRVYERRSQA